MVAHMDKGTSTHKCTQLQSHVHCIAHMRTNNINLLNYKQLIDYNSDLKPLS